MSTLYGPRTLRYLPFPQFDIYKGSIRTLKSENEFLTNWINNHVELTTGYALKRTLALR